MDNGNDFSLIPPFLPVLPVSRNKSVQNWSLCMVKKKKPMKASCQLLITTCFRGQVGSGLTLGPGWALRRGELAGSIVCGGEAVSAGDTPRSDGVSIGTPTRQHLAPFSSFRC